MKYRTPVGAAARTDKQFKEIVKKIYPLAPEALKAELIVLTDKEKKDQILFRQIVYRTVPVNVNNPCSVAIYALLWGMTEEETIREFRDDFDL